jgi:hypothetical protein
MGMLKDMRLAFAGGAAAGAVVAGLLTWGLTAAPLNAKIARLQAARAETAEAVNADLAAAAARIEAQTYVNWLTLGELRGVSAASAGDIATTRTLAGRAALAAERRTERHADTVPCLAEPLPDSLRIDIEADRAALRSDR